MDAILEQTGGEGAGRGCEAVGYQAHDHHGDEVPNLTMNNLVASVKATGGIGVVGVFGPEDPALKTSWPGRGRSPLTSGRFWLKGQRMATGQVSVKAYNRELHDLIEADRAEPSFLISHELPLAGAPDAYKHFDDRDEGWTKVILKPAA